MASKKLKQIMAFDDQLFKAMSPEQFGKGPPALRTVKPKPKPQQKEPRKKNHGVSQFDVLPLGVLDALSTSLLRASQGKQEVDEEVDEIESVEQGSQAPSTAETIPATSSRATEAKAAPDPRPKLQVDQPSSDPAPDVDFSPSELNRELELRTLFSQESVTRPEFDASTLDVFNPNDLNQELEHRTLLSQESTKHPDFETPEAIEVRQLASDSGDRSVLDLVQARRNRVESERRAAADNFQEQQQQPILGIPNPAPIKPMPWEGQRFDGDGNLFEEEKGLGMDAVASGAVEFAQHTVGVLDRLVVEFMALSIRVRNMENLLDRM